MSCWLLAESNLLLVLLLLLLLPASSSIIAKLFNAVVLASVRPNSAATTAVDQSTIRSEQRTDVCIRIVNNRPTAEQVSSSTGSGRGDRGCCCAQRQRLIECSVATIEMAAAAIGAEFTAAMARPARLSGKPPGLGS